VTRFEQPNIWDVAGGIVLAQAAGRKVVVRDGKDWKTFESFAQADPDAAAGRPGVPETYRVLRDWRGSLILGEEDAVAQACQIFA
jgi:myo-inositol-1(or 4)-monophosphatase